MPMLGIQPLSVCAAILVVATGVSSVGNLDVKTPYGTYQGHTIESRGGRHIIAFKGIPYAQAPVGRLRFKEPVKLEESDEVVLAYQEKECLQYGVELQNDDDGKHTPKFVGSEDCLYLNIYKPKNAPKDELLPVYFWIHGGAFFAGSGTETWNGPRLLLDEDRDMVMVSINYRLGILGFLSANDENLPGNLGLKDQTMALKWVKENIHLFGGDPDSITIGGLSAGGASVSHHLNSKASRGLFRRAISQSGTADCSWARKSREESRRIASNLIAALDCPSEPEKLLECLQSLPAEQLLESVKTLKVDNTTMIMHLVPVVEKDSPTAFMTEESIAQGSDVPWLTGVTSEEGLLFYQFLGLHNTGYFDLSILKDHYKVLLPILGYYGKSPTADGLTQEFKKFYFGDKEFKKESTKEFVQFLSDLMFNHGLHVSAKKHKGKLYLYKFSYRGKNSLAVLRPSGLDKSAAHGDDIVYFFNVQFGGYTPLKDKDLDFSNTVLEMWYNFIKSGNPTPETHLWEESEGGSKFLDLTNDGPVMSSNLFQDRMKFLDQIQSKWKLHDEL